MTGIIGDLKIGGTFAGYVFCKKLLCDDDGNYFCKEDKKPCRIDCDSIETDIDLKWDNSCV